MLFHSTRGLAPAVDIRAVALAGLAPDGGLYVPKAWPRFAASDIAAMRDMSYQAIAFRVLRPFMQNVVPDEVLRGAIDASCAVFTVPEVTPLKQVGGDLTVLELFHGPTLAFKDVTFVFLGKIRACGLNRYSL